MQLELLQSCPNKKKEKVRFFCITIFCCLSFHFCFVFMSQKIYNFLHNRSSFLQVKRLVFVQVNLRLVEGMVVGAINIIKVPTLLARDEKMEDHYVFFTRGRCTKARTYTSSNDSVFCKFDGLKFFFRMFRNQRISNQIKCNIIKYLNGCSNSYKKAN